MTEPAAQVRLAQGSLDSGDPLQAASLLESVRERLEGDRAVRCAESGVAQAQSVARVVVLLGEAGGEHQAVVGVDRAAAPAAEQLRHGCRGAGTATRTIGQHERRRGEVFGVVPLSDGRVYWYATRLEPTPEGPAGDLVAAFRDWCAPVPRVLERDGQRLRHPLFDRPPGTAWTRARVSLLGDAAHPMLPFLGQGAPVKHSKTLSRSVRRSPTRGPCRPR